MFPHWAQRQSLSSPGPKVTETTSPTNMSELEIRNMVELPLHQPPSDQGRPLTVGEDKMTQDSLENDIYLAIDASDKLAGLEKLQAILKQSDGKIDLQRPQEDIVDSLSLIYFAISRRRSKALCVMLSPLVKPIQFPEENVNIVRYAVSKINKTHLPKGLDILKIVLQYVARFKQSGICFDKDSNYRSAFNQAIDLQNADVDTKAFKMLTQGVAKECPIKLKGELLDIGNESQNLLLYAAYNGNLQVMREILEIELGSINNLDATGDSALHRAVRRSHFEIVTNLLHKAPNVIITCNTSGESAYQLHRLAKGEEMVVLLRETILRLSTDSQTLSTKRNLLFDKGIICSSSYLRNKF